MVTLSLCFLRFHFSPQGQGITECLINSIATYYDLNCFPQNSHVDMQKPAVTVFTDGAFKEVIKVK